MLAVWEPAVQFDGCVCCKDFNILISWLAGLYGGDDERCNSLHHLVYHVLFTYTLLVYLSLSLSLFYLSLWTGIPSN